MSYRYSVDCTNAVRSRRLEQRGTVQSPSLFYQVTSHNWKFLSFGSFPRYSPLLSKIPEPGVLRGEGVCGVWGSFTKITLAYKKGKLLSQSTAKTF